MAGDKKPPADVTKSKPLTEEQKKQNAKQALKKEVKGLLTQEAKWIQQPTAFDHLPAHEKPFSVEPFPHERQRLPFKMSEEDRLRRKAWLHAQELTDREPMRVPELEQMIYNPFRRLYRLPTDRFFKLLTPVLGEQGVQGARWVVPKLFLGWVGACVAWYQLKYNQAHWEEKKGLSPTLIFTRPAFLPEEAKPALEKPWDYADRGFQSRKVFKGSSYAY